MLASGAVVNVGPYHESISRVPQGAAAKRSTVMGGVLSDIMSELGPQDSCDSPKDPQTASTCVFQKCLSSGKL